MSASHSELPPPPSDASMSDASAASVAATAPTTQLRPGEPWLLSFLRDNKFEGDFEKFKELLPLLPKILGIEANDLAAIEQPVSTADSASEAAAAEAAPTSKNGKEEVGDESAAGAAAAGTSVAGTEKLVWLDFKPTPIRDDITPEIIERILALRYTNRFFRKQSEPYINMLTEQLVALVLNGREDEAKALIEACPYLLERRATVTDPVGRIYKKVTAYEAALYAGDTQMCDMMHAFFERLGERGEEMRLDQYDSVFPDGVKDVIDAQKPYDFNSLIQAINDALPNQVQDQLDQKVTYTALGKAINQFRNDFVALSKQEQHANLKHLPEAFRAYYEDKRIAAWGRALDIEKLDVFSRQVIGFVQMYLPECDKQAFHQGLHDVVVNEKRLTREADFKVGVGMRFLKGFSGCGFESMALPKFGYGGDVSLLPLTRSPYFENLCQTKTVNLKAYSAADKSCETMRDSMT